MRILIFANGYPPNQSGGAEQQTARTAHWFASRGHRVAVVAADAYLAGGDSLVETSDPLDLINGVTVHRVRFSAPDASHPISETFHHPQLDPIAGRYVRDFEPDLIYQVSGYLWGVIPLLKAAELDIPSVLLAVDYWHMCQRFTLLRPSGVCCPGPRTPADCAACRLTERRSTQLLGPAANHLLWRTAAWLGSTPPMSSTVKAFEARAEAVDRALASVGLVICNSAYLEGQMRKLGVPADRILRIRQGLDGIPPRHAWQPQEAESPALRIIYLGQVTFHKGVDLLIEATAQLIADGHDVELRVFGPQSAGPLPVSKEARQYLDHGRIQIHAPIGPDRILDELARADVLVAPSRWYENSPNVILEAQRAGVPVITANHGGMAEMVRDGIDGLLFDPGSATSLAAALRRLATDRAFLTQLRAGVRPPHTVDVEMRAELEAIERLCSRVQQVAD